MSHQKFYAKPLTREDAYELLGFTGEISTYYNYLDAFIEGFEACKREFKACVSLNKVTGTSGVVGLKLQDLDKKFTPDILNNFGHQKDRFIISLPIRTIYEVNKTCIVNQISREGFIDKSLKCIKRQKNNKDYDEQGGLF